jgi:hypothetical protein
MPYLDQPWRPPEEFSEGEWVPEMDQRGWLDRHRGLRCASWVKLDGLTDDDASYLQGTNVPDDDRRKYLKALGADIGSAQRDGFFYANFLEQLKQAATRSTGDLDADKAADQIVERMKAMGFTSASLDERHGGPPKGNSPRPWRAVMKWLSSLVRKVGRFLLNAAQAFGVLARNLIADVPSRAAIAFSASIPPAIAFEIDFDYFTDVNRWKMFKEFIDAILGQMEEIVGP